MRAFHRLSIRSGSRKLRLRSFSVPEEDRMNIHNNARLTPIGRERIVMQVASGQSPQAAAPATGVCPRTIRKWVARYAAESVAGLQDRSSRPKRLHRPTPQAVIAPISAWRPQRRTGKAIAGDRRLAGDRPPGLEAVGLEPPQRRRAGH